MKVFVMHVVALAFLWVCVCSPSLCAQEVANQGWAATESRQHSSNKISLAMTGSRYDAARPVIGISSPVIGQSKTSMLQKNVVILNDAAHREGSPIEILRPRGAQNDASGVFEQPAKVGPMPPFPVLMTKAIIYPRKAVRKKWEGQTVVAAEVLQDGSVGRTAVGKTSGHEVLDQAAQDAIKTWKFDTDSEKDEAIPQYVDIPVTFKLQDEGR